jgi:hypothetical protein
VFGTVLNRFTIKAVIGHLRRVPGVGPDDRDPCRSWRSLFEFTKRHAHRARTEALPPTVQCASHRLSRQKELPGGGLPRRLPLGAFRRRTVSQTLPGTDHKEAHSANPKRLRQACRDAARSLMRSEAALASVAGRGSRAWWRLAAAMLVWPSRLMAR